MLRASALASVTVLLLGGAELRAQGGDLAARVNGALEKARPALLQHLATAAGGKGDAGSPGLLALLCLAALHDGVPFSDPVFEPALRRLARAQMGETYELALRLMVMEAHAGFPDREKLAERDTGRLLRCRHGGLFGYTPDTGHSDLSNTQYGALGLRAAASIGVSIERTDWIDLLDHVIDLQETDGGFGYGNSGRGGRSSAYPSMTVAGIAVMEICRQALEQPGRHIPVVENRLDKAWKWMAKHSGAIGDPDTRSCYYFHYGLERSAILSDLTKVGNRDWYATGAEMMVRDQLRSGGWQSRNDLSRGHRTAESGDPVVTAFAVLFLRRAFKRVAGPLTGARGLTLQQLDDQSTAADIRSAVDLLVSRGTSALPDTLKTLWSSVATRRKAAATALRAITGEDFGYRPDGDPEANRTAIRRAELWYLKNRGTAGRGGK